MDRINPEPIQDESVVFPPCCSQPSLFFAFAAPRQNTYFFKIQTQNNLTILTNSNKNLTIMGKRKTLPTLYLFRTVPAGFCCSLPTTLTPRWQCTVLSFWRQWISETDFMEMLGGKLPTKKQTVSF
jgi:hypothetical protein